MQVQNNVKATAVSPTNSNQGVARHLKVKTRLKGGAIAANTNQSVLRSLQDKSDVKAGDSTPAPSQSIARHLRVKTRLKAGRIVSNANQAVLRNLAAPTSGQARRYARG
jgi:hypothetical protein